MNVADLIATRARGYPQRPAIVLGSRSCSYGELIARADLVAARIRELLAAEFLGNRVPRIGLHCQNSPDYVALALGILKSGACLVPIASELAIPERLAQIELTALQLLISAGARPWLPAPGCEETSDGSEWSWLRLTATARFPEAQLNALGPAFIRFSSGTTGESKGVVLSHATLLERVHSANRRLGITDQDRVLWILPMAHHFAVSIVLYLLEGATVVLEESHLAAEMLTAAREASATVIYGAPFHYQLLAAEDSGRDWPTLRLAVSTAAALDAVTAEAFHRRFHLPLSQGLGIIEAGLPFLNTGSPLKLPLSIGTADDFQFRLCTEAGQPADPAAGGELWLRGPGMFDAYLVPWRERSEATVDGWLATGDIAAVDQNGYLFLRGRRKSVLNVGGMKFFPEEVETVLNQHPQVLASRVIDEAHPRWGAIAVAQIIPADPAQPPSLPALRKHCRASLAAYKIPAMFRFVEELPRTANGKLKR